MTLLEAPATAPAPSRPTASLTLQWGLVPVKIRLFTAVEDTNPVKRSMFTADGNKVVMPKVDSSTNEPVQAADIRYMVAVDDTLVELTDEEMAELTSDFTVDRAAVDIQFVPLDLIGTRYRVEKWYQARSGKSKTGNKSVPDPHADKAFALLLQSMEKRKVACLFRVGLRGPARYAALTPDGRVHFLYYDGEIRAEVEWPDVTISKTEAAQGLELIDLVGISTPDLVDERAEVLLAYVAEKAKSGKGITPKAEADSPVAGVLDLNAALEASLAAAAAKPAKAKKATGKRAAA